MTTGSIARLAGIVPLLAVMSCDASPSANADTSAIAAADRAYADAWLTNDPDLVMATLGPDPVIVPSGMTAFEGEEAIRGFWFPVESPPAVVTVYDISQSDVGGEGSLGYVRGTFRLGFDYEGESFESQGTYLSLLERGEDGAWKITHRMWSDTD